MAGRLEQVAGQVLGRLGRGDLHFGLGRFAQLGHQVGGGLLVVALDGAIGAVGALFLDGQQAGRGALVARGLGRFGVVAGVQGDRGADRIGLGTTGRHGGGTFGGVAGVLGVAFARLGLAGAVFDIIADRRLLEHALLGCSGGLDQAVEIGEQLFLAGGHIEVPWLGY